MSKPVEHEGKSGGIAQFCVEHREVSWLALIAVLVWGGDRLHQTRPAGRSDHSAAHGDAGDGVSRCDGLEGRGVGFQAARAQDQRTQSPSRRSRRTSRPGISTMTIKQLPGSTATIDQQWDKVRAKIRRGAVARGNASAVAEHRFRQHHHAVVRPGQSADHRCRVHRARQSGPRATDRTAQRSGPHQPRGGGGLLPAVHRARSSRSAHAAGSKQRSALPVWPTRCERLKDTRFILADLETSASRAELESFIADFTRTVTGTDRELFHPDFTPPILLMGDEDPLPQIRAHAPPRYSYRTLELLARDFEDELKQVESVGKVTKVAIVQESVYLLFSDANIAGYGLTPDDGDGFDRRAQRSDSRRHDAHRGTQFPGATLRRIQDRARHARHGGRPEPRRRAGLSARRRSKSAGCMNRPSPTRWMCSDARAETARSTRAAP